MAARETIDDIGESTAAIERQLESDAPFWAQHAEKDVRALLTDGWFPARDDDQFDADLDDAVRTLAGEMAAYYRLSPPDALLLLESGALEDFSFVPEARRLITEELGV